MISLPLHAQRRETWCPGALLSKAPLASAAALVANSVQSRLQRISSSPSSEESEFDEMPRDAFLSTLEEEEERKSIEDGRRKVAFASPRAKRFVRLSVSICLPAPCCRCAGTGWKRREILGTRLPCFVAGSLFSSRLGVNIDLYRDANVVIRLIK